MKGNVLYKVLSILMYSQKNRTENIFFGPHPTQPVISTALKNVLVLALHLEGTRESLHDLHHQRTELRGHDHVIRAEHFLEALDRLARSSVP